MPLLHKSEFLLHPDSPEPLDPTGLQLSMYERLDASLADRVLPGQLTTPAASFR